MPAHYLNNSNVVAQDLTGNNMTGQNLGGQFFTDQNLPDQNLTPSDGSSYSPLWANYYQRYIACSKTDQPQYFVSPDQNLSPDQELCSDDSAIGAGLEDMLGMKRELNQFQVDLIMDELRHRRYIREVSLYRINIDQCALSNMAHLRGYEIWDKYRMKLEQSILDLEQEKRRAYETYFRDLLFLNRELRQALLEEREEAHKASILTEMPEVFT